MKFGSPKPLAEMSDLERSQWEGMKKRFATRQRLERAGLFRVAAEKKLLAEISERENLLQENFIHPGLNGYQELMVALTKLEICYRKHSSYYGLLHGYKIANAGLALGHDRTRFHLLTYLFAHPKADNKELVRYLDRKNGKLKELRTSKDSPLWAWLPRSLEQKFDKRGVKRFCGEFWETALSEFPNPTMEYLSRVKKLTKDDRVKNLLIYWPRIFRTHSKERSRK